MLVAGSKPLPFLKSSVKKIQSLAHRYSVISIANFPFPRTTQCQPSNPFHRCPEVKTSVTVNFILISSFVAPFIIRSQVILIISDKL